MLKPILGGAVVASALVLGVLMRRSSTAPPPPAIRPQRLGGFDRAVDEVLRAEGGFVDHPDDPGGATNYGITRATLEEVRGRPVTVDEVRALTRAEAIDIYRRRYWTPIRGDELPAAVAYVTFDGAVHSGVRQASKWLQRALAVEADGRIGPITVGAAQAADATVVVQRILEQRQGFLQRLSTWATFGRGWTARLAAVRAAAEGLLA